MLTDEQLGSALRDELTQLADEVSPRADLAERVVLTRRSQRRRARGLCAGAAVAVATVGSALAALESGSRQGGRLEARLASYHFALPRDATGVSASAADCAMRATVVFPNASSSTSGIGASDANQPAVASAVLGDGGCVSMLLSSSYAPGSATAPAPAFPVLDSHPISIAGDEGTVGTYEMLGNATNGQGISLDGAKNVEVVLQIPSGQGQFQMLLVAAAGVSEQQLESIVASGLNPN